jgi:catechol 2,3-dioxygenase-like lactoylglutathione lyase family enzyme
MPPGGMIQAMPGVNCGGMALRVEKISAVTFRVANMRRSVRFYRDFLGMEIVYAEEQGLRGAAEIWVDADVPRIKQPFWDVESVPVSLAPVAEPIREDIGLWRQL